VVFFGALKIDSRRGVLAVGGAADAFGLGSGVVAGDGAAVAFLEVDGVSSP